MQERGERVDEYLTRGWVLSLVVDGFKREGTRTDECEGGGRGDKARIDN